MFHRTTITTLAALLALAGAADAGAATKLSNGATTARQPTAKQARMLQTQGTKPVHPVITGGTQVAAIEAHPTGGKGSGTEATCDLWTNQLQEDENNVGQASETQDKIDAVNQLNTDVDNAMDAGCFVMYSMVIHQPNGPLTHIKTVSVARMATGGYTTTQWTAPPKVARIAAYPTGGKGSGTEATCALWSKQLQNDQDYVSGLPETEQQDASEAMTDKDVDNALDAGCFVVY